MIEKMLVTGGAGFIGSNFVHQTVNEHSSRYEVTVLDAMTYAGNRASLQDVEGDIRFIQGDICDTALMDRLVREHDVVVNFAGESHVDNSLQDQDPFIHTNVLGVYGLLQAVRKYDRRLHHVSTDEVYGDAADGGVKFTELSPYNPSSPYSATKACSDMLIKGWVRSFGIAATISTCANNYGPRQHVEKFLPRQITNILTGRRPVLYGDGQSIREWTHVDDHNTALHLILQNGPPGESYVIGSGHEGESSVLRVVRQLLDITGQPSDAYDLIPDPRSGHDKHYSTDSTKIRTELGWNPLYTNLRDGLEATVAWYQSNTGWWMPHKEATETKYAAFSTP